MQNVDYTQDFLYLLSEPVVRLEEPWGTGAGYGLQRFT